MEWIHFCETKYVEFLNVEKYFRYIQLGRWVVTFKNNNLNSNSVWESLQLNL